MEGWGSAQAIVIRNDLWYGDLRRRPKERDIQLGLAVRATMHFVWRNLSEEREIFRNSHCCAR